MSTTFHLQIFTRLLFKIMVSAVSRHKPNINFFFGMVLFIYNSSTYLSCVHTYLSKTHTHTHTIQTYYRKQNIRFVRKCLLHKRHRLSSLLLLAEKHKILMCAKELWKPLQPNPLHTISSPHTSQPTLYQI